MAGSNPAHSAYSAEPLVESVRDRNFRTLLASVQSQLCHCRFFLAPSLLRCGDVEANPGPYPSAHLSFRRRCAAPSLLRCGDVEPNPGPQVSRIGDSVAWAMPSIPACPVMKPGPKGDPRERKGHGTTQPSTRSQSHPTMRTVPPPQPQRQLLRHGMWPAEVHWVPGEWALVKGPLPDEETPLRAAAPADSAPLNDARRRPRRRTTPHATGPR